MAGGTIAIQPIIKRINKKDNTVTRSTIYLSPPHMGKLEKHYVQQAFDSNWIAPLGPFVDNFEAALQNYTGVRHAAVLSSGTAAIHLALRLLDVGPDDYVICQSLTFSASANPIRYLGGTPVFVDSEPGTWNMCPDRLEEAIRACLYGGILRAAGQDTSVSLRAAKPKAIIPVHLYGMPARMDEIMQIAKEYDIPVVEDAAESIGSTFKGQQTGSFGTMGILSFNGNKIITTSGGGALLSDDEGHISKARFLATQARDPAPHYQHSHVGYNYRMSNMLAAIGCGQLKVLDERIRQRRHNYHFYYKLLSHRPGISFLHEPEEAFSNRWLTTILVKSENNGGITREHIRIALEKEQIEARPLWKPMHLQPVYEGFPTAGGNIARELFRKGLCLPSGSALTDEDRERIADALLSVLG